MLDNVGITHTIDRTAYPPQPATLHLTINDDELAITSTEARALVAKLNAAIEATHAWDASVSITRTLDAHGGTKDPGELRRKWVADAKARAQEAQNAERAERARITEERTAKSRAAYEKHQAEEHARWAARAARLAAAEEAAK